MEEKYWKIEAAECMVIREKGKMSRYVPGMCTKIPRGIKKASKEFISS